MHACFRDASHGCSDNNKCMSQSIILGVCLKGIECAIIGTAMMYLWGEIYE